MEDVKRGSYVNLVDPNDYYYGKELKSPRHRVVNNLLGNREFSPIVRKSARLIQFEKKKLSEIAKNITKHYDEATLSRAIRYLYTKETIASWEIEREKPDKAKEARFVSLLQKDYAREPLTKDLLVAIQKEIVDERFALDDFRLFQNYVGEEPQPGEVLVHYVAPRPEDIIKLMEGLIQCANRLFASSVDPVVVAAIVAFGFVFMHPFEDGNGRLHRFLIHYVLSKLGFTPDGIVFPISAVILRDEKEYHKALESFSEPLLKQIADYQINELGEMTVKSETVDFYRYIDFTPIAEFLYQCVDKTIQKDLESELDFLNRYDLIKRQIKEIVDMPERRIDLFIKSVRQNNGKLSLRKRNSLFKMLTEEEILLMEEVIRQNTR